MFKKTVFSLIFLFVLLSSATLVLAQDYGLKATADKAQYGDSTDIYLIIKTVLQVGLSMVGIVFLGVMFYVGLRWMTARGNEEFATKAKDALFNATMGFVLVSLAYALTTFIFGKLLK
jgi:hypothetical protein